MTPAKTIESTPVDQLEAELKEVRNQLAAARKNLRQYQNEQLSLQEELEGLSDALDIAWGPDYRHIFHVMEDYEKLLEAVQQLIGLNYSELWHLRDYPLELLDRVRDLAEVGQRRLEGK